jgi:putative ABC transport system permease protein
MDLKFALRSMRNNPGFTLLAVLIMALGIGANTAVFSVVNTVLLKPLAYRDPDRIVTLRNFWKKSSSTSTYISAPDFHDWHDQSTAFDAMAYYAGGQTPVLSKSTAEYAEVTEVTSEFFDVMGVKPLIGRPFNDEERKPGSGGAVLISAAYWQSHFGGAPNVIGQTVRIFEKALPIVGVMPASFDFPQNTSIWYPADTIYRENTHRGSHNYYVIGRLKPDIAVDQAQAQMTPIALRLEQLYPPSNVFKGVKVERMQDTLVGDIRVTLYVLLAAVGAVLLIACANMANLLLSKATRRTREMAIRAAVGASRARIVRQLIIESLLLACVAGTAGLILAVWGAEAMKLVAPSSVPRLADTATDGWVLAFTLGVSVISSLIFGLAPALAASRIDLNESLKQGATKAVVGGGAGRLRAGLVVAEIALSVVLLTSAGLLIRSFDALTNVDLGFRPEKILVASTSVPSSTDSGRRRAVQFDDDILATLASLPGVSYTSAAAALPGNPRSNGSYWVDHLPPPDQRSNTAPNAVFSVVAPGMFQTLGIPLKAGRDFNARDGEDAPFTVVINETLARKSFPGENPLGRVLFCGLDSSNPMTIVGIAGDVRQWGPGTPPMAEMFMPYAQHPGWATDLKLLLRTSADPAALSEAVRRKIQERDPAVPVKFSTMQESVAAGVAGPRFRMVLLGIFAALAVCLAMAGVYGVMSYMVGQRANEIGLRMALGASSRDVLRLVLGQGLLLAAIGLGIGLAGAVAATRLLRSLLFEVKPNDPLTYAAVAGILAVIALAACCVPALRATRVDPLVALRQE